MTEQANQRTLKYEQIETEGVIQVFRTYNPSVLLKEKKKDGSPASTFFKPGDTAPNGDVVKEPWERESTFSPEQLEYIYLMNILISGLITGTDIHKGKSLSARIAESAENSGYVEAVSNAMLTIIDDFCKLYPKLIPALYTFLVKSGAGATGISIAVSDAIAGTTKQEALTNYAQFIGTNTLSVEPVNQHPFEQICKGIPIALNIIDQIRIADTLSPRIGNITAEDRIKMGKHDKPHGAFPKVLLTVPIRTLIESYMDKKDILEY